MCCGISYSTLLVLIAKKIGRDKYQLFNLYYVCPYPPPVVMGQCFSTQTSVLPDTSSPQTKYEAERIVELSELESSPAVSTLFPITTVTFYTGSPDAAELHLRQRTAEIVALNPWLIGRLTSNKTTGRTILSYDPAPAKSASPFHVSLL